MEDAPECIGTLPHNWSEDETCCSCAAQAACQKLRDRFLTTEPTDFVRMVDLEAWWRKRFHAGYASGSWKEMASAWNRGFRDVIGKPFVAESTRWKWNFQKAATYCAKNKVNADLWVHAQIEPNLKAVLDGRIQMLPNILCGARAVVRFETYRAQQQLQGFDVDRADFLFATKRSHERTVYGRLIVAEQDIVQRRLMHPTTAWSDLMNDEDTPDRKFWIAGSLKTVANAVDLSPYQLTRTLSLIRARTGNMILDCYGAHPSSVFVDPELTYASGRAPFEEFYDGLILACRCLRPSVKLTEGRLRVRSDRRLGTAYETV